MYPESVGIDGAVRLYPGTVSGHLPPEQFQAGKVPGNGVCGGNSRHAHAGAAVHCYNILLAGVSLPRFKLFGFIRFERFLPGVIALSLNSGAYLCEIIRSGIQSIDLGQTEAARSLGMTQWQNMQLIVLPQAIKNILPAIANEFVTIIKESSICYTIGVQEIMYGVNSIKGATFSIGEPLIIAAVVYFCLTFPTSKIIAYFERRMSRGDRR